MPKATFFSGRRGWIYYESPVMTGNYCETDRTVPHGPFHLDFEKNQCILPNGEVKLFSPREMQVLVRLSDVQFRSRKDIALSVAAEAYPDAQDLVSLVTEEYVGILICSLREKLGDQSIMTKKGHGYLLNVK
jgi:DNA-binding response OmpR family regulator